MQKARKTAFAKVLRIGLGLTLGAVLSVPSRSGLATEQQKLNRVQKVRVERTDVGRIVDIACEGEPVFTVFRLSDPVRIVIDIARGDVSKLDGPIEVDDGVVGDIAVAQFSDDRNALGRLIIGLEKAFDYEVKASGGHVRVAVRADGGPSPLPLARRAPVKPVEVAKVEPVKAEPMKAAPVKLDAPKPVEVAKVEPAKVEPAKPEAKPAPAVVAKVEAPKVEAPKAVAAAPVAKVEAKVEEKPAPVIVAKTEAVKAPPAKVEAKPEPVKAAPVTPAPVVAKVEPAKAEPVKVAPAAPAPVVVAKIEPVKPEPVKAEIKPEPAKAALVAPAPVVAKVEPVPAIERSVHDISSVVVDKSLERVTVQRKRNGTDVLVAIKGGKPTYEILELEDPPRVVFDFIGVATKLPKSSHWNLGATGKLRLGVHHDKVRFVLDGTNGLPKYEISFAGGAVRISTEPMPKPAAEPLVAEVAPAPAVVAPVAVAKPVETKQPEPTLAKVAAPVKAPLSASPPQVVAVASPAPAPTKSLAPVAPAPVVAAPAAAPAPVPAVIAEKPTEAPKTDRIAALDFAKQSEGGKLSFVASEGTKLDLDRSVERAPVLILSNAELSKDLEKSTDVSRLKTGLLRITSFNERKGKGGARIIANLATVMNHRTYREGERVVWEFTPVVAAEPVVAQAAPQGLQPAPAPAPMPENDVKVTMKPALEVAGFSAEATQIVRSTSTGSSAGKRLSLDVRGADLLNVLRYISEVSGENIVAGDDVTGKITIRLRNVSWEQALDVALKTKGFGRVKTGSIIRVAPLKKLQEEKEQELARQKADEKVAPTFVRLMPVNYANAKDVLTQLTPLLTKDRGTATVDERTNTIIAEDLPEVLNKLENLAKRLDTQTPQVLIEARIVEANTQHVRDIGIQWGGSTLFSPATGNATGLAFPNILGLSGGADDANTNSTGTGAPPRFAVNLPSPVGTGAGGSVGMIFGNAANTGLLSLRLSALENNGSVRIVSAPKVTTLDNVRAKISQGVSIPISVTSAAGVNTRFVDAFLSLEVRPHVTQDGSIMMEIKASKNEPNFARTGAAGDPTIETKVAETQVLVKDGDTTVIGGIYTRNSSTTFNEVPFLSKIPVLGWLFKRKREEDARAELLVFITPRIVNRQQSSVSGGGF